MKTLRLWFAVICASVIILVTRQCPDCDGTGEGVHMNYEFPCELCGGKGWIF